MQGKDVGPAKLKEVAAFLASPESAAVRRLVLSGNMITDRGKDLSGLKELCEVLPTLEHPISLDLANCGLGVAEVAEVATTIQAGAAVTSINCLANNFGEEGLAMLLEAIERTSVRSLSGLVEGQTVADFSGQNLQPIDLSLIHI